MINIRTKIANCHLSLVTMTMTIKMTMTMIIIPRPAYRDASIYRSLLIGAAYM